MLADGVGVEKRASLIACSEEFKSRGKDWSLNSKHIGDSTGRPETCGRQLQTVLEMWTCAVARRNSDVREGQLASHVSPELFSLRRNYVCACGRPALDVCVCFRVLLNSVNL
jgi:hypothetical protein